VDLSHVLKRNIQVMRHDMSIQMFPDPETQTPYEGDPLRLSYHIHEYSGGEHYNSIVSLEDKNRRNRAPRGNRSGEVGLGSSSSQAAAVCAGDAAACSQAGAAPQAMGAAAGARQQDTQQHALTEEERIQRTQGRKANAAKKVTKQAKKPVAPWVRGVGSDDDRVTVWDSRTGRLFVGNACPSARNIDRYLQDKPYMRLWRGGLDPDEPKAPVRAEDKDAQVGQSNDHAVAASGTFVDADAPALSETGGKAWVEPEDDGSGCSRPAVSESGDEEAVQDGSAGLPHEPAARDEIGDSSAKEAPAAATASGPQLHAVSLASVEQQEQLGELLPVVRVHDRLDSGEGEHLRGGAAAATTPASAMCGGSSALDPRKDAAREDENRMQEDGRHKVMQSMPNSDKGSTNLPDSAPQIEPPRDGDEPVAIHA